jgi:glycosyltransferase involved in cell wall biosynthesis
MKILQVLCGRAWGGGSVVVLAITRALIARGDEVWVVSFEEENDRRFREAGAILARPPVWFHPINPLDVIPFLYFWNLCRREKFDLVATHTSKGGFLGRLAAHAAGVPRIVHHAHGFSFNRPLSPRMKRFYISLERFAARADHLIIAVNEQQRRMAVEFGVDRPAKLRTVHNGIDLRAFEWGDREATRGKLGFDESALLVGAVGRLAPQKGFTYLIRALPLVLAAAPEVHLVIVGDGPLKAELEREAYRAGVSEHVHLLGFRRDISNLLGAFDIFAQPSLWEGLSISLIEALAAGKPVVATDIEGNREVVDHGETGLLVRPADPDAFAEGLIALLLDRSLAKRFGDCAPRVALKRFSEERMVAEILAAYDGLPEARFESPACRS